MGSRFEILIDTVDCAHTVQETQSIAEELKELVLDWHDRLSFFDPHSITSLINRTKAETPVRLDDDMFDLVVLCDQLRVRTCGAFNISAGTLMKAHGFRDSIGLQSNQTTFGFDIENAFVLDHIEHSITRTHECALIDFGAIAKGFVLDLIHNELNVHGITNAFIHGGTSSILAVGQNQSANPWGSQINAGYQLALTGQAVGVSEPRSQTRTNSHETAGHIMDPISGKPVQSTIQSVACVHESAATADAYSTACCVDPTLIDKLCSDPCTLIAFDSSSPTTIRDPLRVVYSPRAHHDRT